MQKILIPTDFSSIADNALNYAIEIADRFGSELLLYHVYTFHKKVDFDWDYPEDEQPFVKKIEKKMNFTKLKFEEKIRQKGLRVQTVVKEENISTLFKQEVVAHKVDLIVMGSKGASGLEKVVFGSTAALALEVAKVPVLVVPPDHSIPPLEQIIFAADLKEVSENTLSPLQKLALQFGAKVSILYVNSGTDKGRIHENSISFRGVEATYREVPMSNNINESIDEFIKNNRCDLLCMVRREKGFFESLFSRSVTKTQVYNSKTPFLALPENQ